MTQTQQPEALRLARKFEEVGFMGDHRFAKDHWCRQAAAELRHQHARIEELEDVADMAIKRIEELEAQLSATIAEPVCKQAVPASVIAGAIYDFAGYLTTLPHKEAIHCSVVHDAVPMVKAINDWCKRRNLCTDDARFGSWREAIATQPAAQGMDACKDRDTIFFLAGWNGCNEGLDAHEQFKKAAIAAQAKQGGV